MNEVKQEDVELILNALNEYRPKVVGTNEFRPVEFVHFMESKFFDAGYRPPNFLPRPRSGQGKILIIHDTGVGDFILMSAAIREIRRLHPTAKIILLITAEAKSMAEFCPYVDEIFMHDSGTECRADKFVTVYDWAMRNAIPFLRERIDICYSFTHFYVTQILMYMTGAQTRYAYLFEKNVNPSNSPFMLSEWINYFATNLTSPFLYGSHHVDAYLSFLDAQMNLPIANRELEIWCTREELDYGESILEGRVGTVYALNMGGSGLCKHYPPEKYAKVAEMILSNETSTIVILGGGEEDLKSAEIFKNALPTNFHENIIDLTDKLSYRQSAALLKHCTAYIGDDTGIMHAAAAVKRPILVVFPFAADLPQSIYDSVRAYRPYNVPSVVIQPARALPECKSTDYYSQYGCKIPNVPHCITQVKPEIFLYGLQLLRERTLQRATEPIYIC